MKKKINKKISILLIIITLLIITGILATVITYKYFNRYLFKDLQHTIQTLGFNKDIIISEHGGHYSYGGYATSSYKYYIDLTQKKVYHELDYYIYSPIVPKTEQGSHLSIVKEKELTDDEINEVIQLTKIETPDKNTIITNNMLSYIQNEYVPTYYIITYNDTYTIINGENYSKLSKIIY